MCTYISPIIPTISLIQFFFNKMTSPSENSPLNDIKLILLIIGLVEFLLLHLLKNRKTNSSFFLFSQFHSTNESKNCMEKSSAMQGGKKIVDQSVSGDDVATVLTRLGMSLSGSCDDFAANYDCEELLKLFEERNPSLDEVKEAFDVFDENGDGFIDAHELQKVMFALRLKEGFEVEKCRLMIGVFDGNGDGRLDFEEFVEFLEISLFDMV